MNTIDPVRDDVQEAVRRVLRERLGSIGFREAEVRAGYDHGGDPALFIDARYDFMQTPIEPTLTFSVIRLLRNALEAVGETRFPHVRHHFDERQRVSGW